MEASVTIPFPPDLFEALAPAGRGDPRRAAPAERYMDAEAAAAYLGVPVKALRTRFNAEPRPKGSWSAAMDLSSLWNLLWIYFILSSLMPLFQKQWLAATRRRMLVSIAQKRDATVITLIHRQETIALLGFPLMRHIDIDDSQSVLRAIRSTPPGRGIEIILHTPGGLVLAASQIAKALSDHEGHVVAVVPHYAMSGGTLIALAADEIVIDRHAALGPVDPQLGQYPAASLVAVSTLPGEHDDKTLILADVGRKALRQVEVLVTELLGRHSEPGRAREVARLLSSGAWTHDHPLMAHELELLGLPVRFGVPEEERTLLDLYPQPRGRQEGVEYFPGRPIPGLPQGRETPRTRESR